MTVAPAARMASVFFRGAEQAFDALLATLPEEWLRGDAARMLSEDERRRFNHPKAILRYWRKGTEPAEERAMHLEREMRKALALAETALELDDVRAEDLRGLLGRVLDEVEDLHPALREAIERELAS